MWLVWYPPVFKFSSCFLMAYQVLARKWRPQNFSQLVGQEHVSRSLCNAIHHNRLHHAYLFTGTRGVGKTTIARILAKAINCENLQDFNPCGQCAICQAFEQGRFLDLIEVDAASRTKVDDTRELLENAQYAPSQGRFKIYLIDEVHMLSGHSFNALLKTLEEPPLHVKFLLATTDPQKIPVTVLSRCLQFNLKRLQPEQIEKQMAYILNEESIAFEDQALKQLARAADGSLRDGLSLLDQAIAFGNGAVYTDTVLQMLGTISDQPVDDLLRALASGDAFAMMQKVDDLAELTPDFTRLLQQMLMVLHRVAMAQMVPGLGESGSEIVTELAQTLSAEDVQLFYQIALVGQKDLELTPNPRNGFEMILLRMLAFQPQKDAIEPAKPQTQPIQRPEAPQVIDKPVLEVKSEKPQVTQEPVKPPESSKPRVIGQEAWEDIVPQLNIRGPALELANNCLLDSIDNTVCHLLVDVSLKQYTQRSEENLAKALQEYFSLPLQLKISQQAQSLMTPAKQKVIDQENRQQAAEAAIEQDDNINALKKQFDARVLPGTIEPHQE
jgi:DNA polymerase-3 subunit gamma/tau